MNKTIINLLNTIEIAQNETIRNNALELLFDTIIETKQIKNDLLLIIDTIKHLHIQSKNICKIIIDYCYIYINI